MKLKPILITGGILAALALVFFFIRRKAAAAQIDAAAGKPGAVDTYSEPYGHATFPLCKGSKGIEVLYYQAFLNMVKGALIQDLDGIWGNETDGNSNEFADQLSVSKAQYDFIISGYYTGLTQYLKQKGAL